MLKYHIRMRDLARHVTKQASVLVVQRLGLILPNGSDVRLLYLKIRAHTTYLGYFLYFWRITFDLMC